MNTNITLTNIEENELKAKALQLYPDKGLAYMITKETHKFIREHGGIDALCEPCDLEVIKVLVRYRVPDTLLGPLHRICEHKKISLSTFISRFILHPHLDK